MGAGAILGSYKSGGSSSAVHPTAAVLPDDASVLPDWKGMYWGPVVDRPEGNAHTRLTITACDPEELPARSLLGRTVSSVRAQQWRAEMEAEERKVCEEELALLANQTLAL
jgi:hypothetical protein